MRLTEGEVGSLGVKESWGDVEQFESWLGGPRWAGDGGAKSAEAVRGEECYTAAEFGR